MPEFDRLRALLMPELFDERKPGYREYEFQHGWNAALRFAFRQMELLEIQIEAERKAAEALKKKLEEQQT